MKLQPAVVRETKRIAAGTSLMLAVMLLVYLTLGRLNTSVVLGGLYGGCIAVLNFLALGVTVQNSVSGIQGEDEAQAKKAKNLMQFSYSVRMLLLLALAALGIAVFKFDGLATLLPLLFPRITIAIISVTNHFTKRKETGVK
ncbi:MAG: ATP synthase subunit I [Clostridia bacterium]|nr:ATP synthase subunit I [Clostridia bacterium]